MMMKVDLRHMAVAATALIAFAAQAQFVTGNKLLERLDGSNPYERGFGMAYVLGVADMGFGLNHCPPDTVTAGQVRDLTHQYLRANPGTREQSADLLVMRALRAVWPCLERGKGSAL